MKIDPQEWLVKRARLDRVVGRGIITLLMWHHDIGLPEDESVRLRGRPLDYLRRLWQFFSPYRGQIVRAGVLLLVSSGLGLLGPVLLKRAIDVNIAAGERGLAGLALTSLLYLLVQAGAIAAGYFQSVWLAQAGELGAADLKFRLLRHLLDLPVSFFDRMPVGRLISRVESDTEALKMLFARTTVTLVQAGLMILGMSVVMAITNWRLYLLVLVLMPPFAIAFWIFQQKVRPVYLAVRKTVAETNSLVAESLRALPVIGAFCQEERFARRMDELNRQKFRQEVRAAGMWSILWALVDFGDVICTGLVVAVGGIMALQGRLTIGTLFLFVSYIARLFGPLRMISDQINVLQRGLASAERSFELLDQPVEPGG
ncbi:MAG: ABC transporter ATP-binding protein, partial [candidate division WOR-3 bacterium]